MTIKEFINTSDWKEKLANHITVEYAPLERKSNATDSIVNLMYADGIRNSMVRYLWQRVEFVLMHTDLTLTENAALDDFNVIQRNNLVGLLKEYVNPGEWEELDALIDLACADREYNDVEPHNFIKGQVERFGELIGTSLGPVLEGIDWKGMLAELTANGGTVEE